MSKIKVACLQIRATEYKDRYKNQKNILRKIDQAAKSFPQLMVLPECVYPSYYLSSLKVKNFNEYYESSLIFVDKIKRKAIVHKCYIAIGIVEYSISENILYNCAILINPEGDEICRYRKSYLWYFDSNWFYSGTKFPVVQTEIAKIGMFICADGRHPEIARCLSLQGADLLLDLTNWNTPGFENYNLTNPQIDYIIPTRSLENRIWIIAANKVGMEAKSILYCGRSAIFSPDGQIVKMASSYKEEILLYEIDVAKSKEKNIDNRVNVFKDRRPHMYYELVKPVKKINLYDKIRKSNCFKNKGLQTAIVQISFLEDMKKYMENMEYFINISFEMKVDIIVFPESNNIFNKKGEEIIYRIKKITKKFPNILCVITATEKNKEFYYKTTFLIESGKLIGKYRKSHLEREEKAFFRNGNSGLPVFKTHIGYVGVMIGYEGIFSEIARILTLKGADIIIWPAQFPNDIHLNICRSRGAENKVFIACANSISNEGFGHSLVTSPSGQVLTSCLSKIEQLSICTVDLSLSWNKKIAPNTDTFLDRKPDCYSILVKKSCRENP